MTAPGDIGAWAQLPFWQDQWPAVQAALARETDVLPPPEHMFAALRHTPPDAVRVVILGQDPYPTPGHANGLAFAVAKGVALPRSLANIYREMEADLGLRPTDGDLTFWADQGVLLLNTALSVLAGSAGAHARLGWDALIDQVLAQTATRPTAYVLWGAKAQARAKHITGPSHFKLETAHPSPLSARRGFFGSAPFSRVNAWLEHQGQTPIDWAGQTMRQT